MQIRNGMPFREHDVACLEMPELAVGGEPFELRAGDGRQRREAGETLDEGGIAHGEAAGPKSRTRPTYVS